MRVLLTIFLSVITHISFGQTKTIQIPVYRQTDTTLWYIWTQENIRKIGLSDLRISSEVLHFRFWTERQAIDIWTIDNKTFEGKFINYTKEYDPNKYKIDKPKPEKFYCKVDNIDTATARLIFDFINNQHLFQVPFQDSIKGWSTGTDGDTYLMEYSTPSLYAFKDYWAPQIQKGIKEAAIIDTTTKYMKTTLNMNYKWMTFIDRLPKGCYHAGSILLTCNNRKAKKKNRS